MNHLKSYGTCTCNEQGMFEIHWETESTWFKKLFKIQTEFKYMCDYEVGKRIYHDARYLNQLDVKWFDSEGVLLTDVVLLNELKFLLQWECYCKTILDKESTKL